MKSKHEFNVDPSDRERMKAIYASTTTEERAMQTHTNRGRRTLSASDHAHNCNVRRLFNNIIPGLPIDADPPELHHEPDCMDATVSAVMSKLNIHVHEWIDDLRAAWPAILPADITRNTRPAKLENNILFVEVASSIALFELRRARLKEIEQAVRRFAPDKTIRHVQLIVNHSPL